MNNEFVRALVVIAVVSFFSSLGGHASAQYENPLWALLGGFISGIIGFALLMNWRVK